ncbi:MAG: very short patch repair endonuclease [Verrucomicrobiae bacterium]|nr:very short patch repair endonuclease [Verrucomicrobiae bacterium]
MADSLSPEGRSQLMSRVRGKGNQSTEMRMIAILRDAGITGWRRNQDLAGRPDFLFRPERVALFVDGCFWHGCPKCYRRPKSNQAFWDEKIRKNTARDRAVNRELKRKGWIVVRVWEHELKAPGKVAGKIRRALSRS